MLAPHLRIIYGRQQGQPRGRPRHTGPLVMVLGGHRSNDGRHGRVIITKVCRLCVLEDELSAIYRSWRQDVATRTRFPWRTPT